MLRPARRVTMPMASGPISHVVVIRVLHAYDLGSAFGLFSCIWAHYFFRTGIRCQKL